MISASSRRRCCAACWRRCTASPGPRSAAPSDPAQSAEEREAYADWAAKLGYAAIHRLWQLLLKGHGEVHSAPMPLEAAEMALLRVIHASELPDPGAMIEKLASGEADRGRAHPPRRLAASRRSLMQAPPAIFPALVAAACEKAASPISPSSCTIMSAWSAMRRPSLACGRSSRFPAISRAIWPRRSRR